MTVFSIWHLAYALLLCECVACLILVLPMPSNRVRFWLVSICQKLSASTRVRTTEAVLLVITLFLFLDSLRTINRIDQHAHAPGSVHSEMLEKVSLFRNQRNAYLTGFILFFGVVLYRLQEITVQLYELRKAHKERIAGTASASPTTTNNTKED